MDKEYKNYCTLSAIYRMLRLKKIDPKKAERLLHERANKNPELARAIVSLWLTSYPIRAAWGQA
jgi:hypothetical protein